MADVWSALDAREQALLIWALVFLIGVLLIREVRRAIPGILVLLVTPPLSLLLLGAIVYVGAIVAFAAALGLWNLPLLGVTILWFLGPGIVMFFNAHDAVTDPHYFRRALRGTVFLTVIVEFVANLAVFPLAVEMIALPILLRVVMLGAFAETKSEFADVKKIMDVLLGGFGVVFVGRTLYAVATDFESYATLETLMRLVLPPALTVAFLGYVYLLSRYMIWEHRRLHPVGRHGKLVESSGGDRRRIRRAPDWQTAA